jgi:cytochrome P450
VKPEKFTAPAPQDWAEAQPHASWADARAAAAVVPAAPSSFDSREAVVVTRFAAADAVVRDPDTFSSAIHTQTAGVFKGETMRGMDGDEHRRHRALVATAFRPSAVERWRTTAIEPVIHELIDAIEPRGRADLVADVTTRFPVQVICTIIGLPRDDHEQFVEWSEAINLGVLDPERGHAAAEALTGYLRPIVDARRADPTDDLISGLVQAEIDGERLSEDRIFSFLRLLVPAGAETTSRAMGNALVALLTHPDALTALRDDRSMLPAVVEECLRWETPVAMVIRVATRDIELDGCPIAAGTPVTVLTSSANRDERRWPDADEWRPNRPQTPHLAFGAGPHACLGVNLARAELHAGVGALLDRLPGLALDPDGEEPVIAGYAFRGPHRLPVVFGE